MKSETATLLSGRRLAHNALWNVAGLVTPLLAAAVSLPLLIAGFGTERFGLLAVIWMCIGYFSLFDMGLGRSLTKFVADRLGAEEHTDLGTLVWNALFLIAVLGAGAALLVAIGAPWLVDHVLRVPASFREEALACLRLLALSLPFVTSTAALIGLLEAHQRFLLITSIRIPLGLWTFLGPLLTLQFSPSLETATLVLVAGRIVATLVFFVMARRVVPELRRVILGELRHTRELLAFGGWLTLSNVVGPVLVYADRFLISALLGLTAVAYYATPFVVVSRLFVLPHALMGVLFPAFVTSFAVNRERLRTLTSQSMFTLLAGMLPLVAVIFLFAPEAMTLWLGAEFARHATVVARWLAIGALFNSLARIPLSLTTASGRPDLVAKLHLAEMLPYGVCLWLLMQWHGIEGAAMAWTLRVLVDLLALMAIASRRVAGLGGIFFRTVLVCALGTALLLVAFWLDSIAMRATIWLILTVALGGMLWRTYLPLRASEN